MPAILRRTYEGIKKDWDAIIQAAEHVQIDVTDGVFAGDGSFRDLQLFKKLIDSRKIELHMMVHTPANFLDDIIELNPARCVFHIESFAGSADLKTTYEKLHAQTQSELGLAINPESQSTWLEEHLNIIDFVLFMSYSPGWANQPINELVYNKIKTFHEKHPGMCIAIDGHINKETIGKFIQSGASILYANTAIFGEGNPVDNFLELSAKAAMLQN